MGAATSQEGSREPDLKTERARGPRRMVTLRLSLRTPLRIEAMSRATRLLAAYHSEETRLMTETTRPDLSPETIAAILTETLRAELARILADQDHGPDRDDDEIETRVTQLEAHRTTLRRNARRNQFTEIQTQVLAAAQALNLALSAPLSPDLGRKASDLLRDILELEKEVLDGADGRSEAAALVKRVSTASVDDFVAGRRDLPQDGRG